MKVEKDYEELFKLLNNHKVKYCIIGAYAVAFYARPRYTKDIDILIQPSKENCERILKALYDFGFGNLGLSSSDFCSAGKIIQLGYEPVRVDLLTSVQGCSFERAWKNRVIGMYGEEKVYFIGIDDLIKIKKLSPRPYDKTDVQLLIQAKKKSKF
jgi:predicted nucleotidyltransferase